MNPHQKKTILIVSANPKDTRRLRSDEEIREIKTVLERSKYHGNFRVETSEATTVKDLQSTLLKYTPHIVHFCGHGNADGLLLEDAAGMQQPVPVDELATLFAICVQECDKPIECVVLNACYSETQAEAIHQHIPYVIGMNASNGTTTFSSWIGI
jgi:CHAT domain-containing protein